MSWFATLIDRDFTTRQYGDGHPRLYTTPTNYTSISGVSYSEGVLIVKDHKGNHITIDKEPNKKQFKKTVFARWKAFDMIVGVNDENRSDFEPYGYRSIKALACDLGLCKEKNVKLYFDKKKKSN